MMHRDHAELTAAFANATSINKEQGTIKLIVARLPQEQRSVLQSAKVTIAEGVDQDRWQIHPTKGVEEQITIMNFEVAHIVAVSEERIPECGDNFYVDMDLSEKNLPAGTQLKIGSAILQITAEPHRGCLKFSRRFGNDALKFVNDKKLLTNRLRGVKAKVIQDGIITINDKVEKLKD